MNDTELAAFAASSAEGVFWRLAMHPKIPLSLVEAHEAPIDLILQAEVMLAYVERTERRRALEAAHRQAVNRYRRRR